MKAHDVNLKKKIYALLGFYSLLILGLMVGSVHHQVIKRNVYLSWAQKQDHKPVRLIPLRGRILDRRGCPMALSIETGSVFAHPPRIHETEKTARLLARTLDMDPDVLRDELTRDVSFTWLARQVPREKAEAVRKLELRGIGIEKEGKRYYPNRELAGHVIGFSGIDSQGLEGLEWGFDSYLKGRQGTLMLQHDARGRPLWQGVSMETGRKGCCELRLTLDLRIQFFTEQALSKAVQDAGALSGFAVVLDPRSGEVFALACAPVFDPNRFSGFKSSQWRNRSITDTFEPGSTAKAFLLSAALEEGVVSESTRIHCENGRFSYGGRCVHDMKPRQTLTVREILMYSSNIGITKIADLLGGGNLWNYLNAFGFGQKTGFDLPGEASGSLRHWKTWAKISLATHAFGQGFAVTGIQLASAFAVLANGGFLIEPYMVQQIRDENGSLLVDRKPRVIRRVISKRTADRVLKVLESVVEEGTGQKARIAGFSVAGKTGTAQKFDSETGQYSKDRAVVSFVGVVPADSPEMVIAVILDEPQGNSTGGTSAAPAFREIASRSLYYRRVPGQVPVPDDEPLPVRLCTALTWENRGGSKLMQGQEAEISLEEQRMPALKGLPLRSALRVLEGLPITIRMEGSGTVVFQRPKPDSRIQAGQTLWLRASPEGWQQSG